MFVFSKIIVPPINLLLLYSNKESFTSNIPFSFMIINYEVAELFYIFVYFKIRFEDPWFSLFTVLVGWNIIKHPECELIVQLFKLKEVVAKYILNRHISVEVITFEMINTFENSTFIFYVVIYSESKIPLNLIKRFNLL